MFKSNNFSIDNLDFSMSIGENPIEEYSTLWTEAGNEYDMIDEATDYEMLTPSQLQSRCKDAEKKFKYLERKISVMKKEKGKVEDCTLDSNDDRRSVNTKIEELKKLNNDLMNDKNLQEHNMEEMERAHAMEIEDLEDTIVNLEKNVKSWQKKYKDKMNEVQSDSDEKEELEDLRKKLKELNRNMKRKDYDIEDLHDNIHDLEKKINLLKKDGEKYSSELENQIQVNDNLSKVKENLQKELEEKNRILKKFENNITKNVQNIELENKIQIINEDCIVKQREIERLKEENGKLCEIKNCLQKTLSSTKNELAVTLKQLSEYTKTSNKTFPTWWLKHMN